MIIKLIICIIVIVILYDFISGIWRQLYRRKLYDMALVRAKEKNKKLLVVGDPDNGAMSKIFGRNYDCGDICVDLIGCKKCENSITEKVEDVLPKLRDNSYVIFISCVLEYIDDDVIDRVISDLKRVSGGDLFIVSVDPYCLSSVFYYGAYFTGETGAKRRIFTEYPFKEISYEKN